MDLGHSSSSGGELDHGVAEGVVVDFGITGGTITWLGPIGTRGFCGVRRSWRE